MNESLNSLANGLLCLAAAWFWSVKFLWVQSVSLAKSGLGDVRLPGHIDFHWQIFHKVSFSFCWCSFVPAQFRLFTLAAFLLSQRFDRS